MKIAILLATYNSTRFIRQQLDSLYSQTITEWELYVHDDGSKDNTIDIVREYNEKYQNIKIIGEEIKGLGPRDNFLFLLNNVCADYYFFCDHDDIWLPTKIERAIQQLQSIDAQKPGDIPAVYHSDLILVDKDLNRIAESMWGYAKIVPELMHKKQYVLCATFITGCTLAINRAMKSLVSKCPDFVYMHDWWIGVNAVMNNVRIISDHEALILYRLHGNNTAGIDKTTAKRYWRKISQLFSGSPHDRKIKPLIKKYKIRGYWLYKRLLIINRLLHKS